ncbi:MAG: RNA polymerase sigma factor SigZ [Bacteroidota bacterium]
MEQRIEQVWRDFHQELKGFIQQKVGSPFEADDILQEVFVKVILNQEKVFQAHNIRQYLYGMVRNTTIDFLRKRRNQDVEIEEALIFSEEESESLNRTLAESCIRPFINELPEMYREALLCSELEGLPQKELAHQLGISYSGAKSRVQRGREKLKSSILDCCQLYSDSYGNLRWEKDGCGPC